jgi:hypothetical protein
MKSVTLVLVWAALVGCQPNPTAGGWKPGPTEPCVAGKAVCIVSVDGISLIRAPAFWLLDLRGRSRFDVGKVIAAAKRCDGPQGCGRAMTRSEIEALNTDLAVKTVPRASILGTPVVAHQLDAKRTVLQVGPPTGGPADLGLLRFPGLECDPGTEPDCGNPPHPPIRNQAPHFPVFVGGPIGPLGPGDPPPPVASGWQVMDAGAPRTRLPLSTPLP